MIVIQMPKTVEIPVEVNVRVRVKDVEGTTCVLEMSFERREDGKPLWFSDWMELPVGGTAVVGPFKATMLFGVDFMQVNAETGPPSR